jgi:hypothetical protein
VTERPDDAPGLEIEGGWIDIPPNVNAWPEGADRPEQVLCRSVSDPLHYKVFKYRRELDPAEFREIGMNFGGTFSKSSWERFAKSLPSLMALHAIPDEISHRPSSINRSRGSGSLSDRP